MDNLARSRFWLAAPTQKRRRSAGVRCCVVHMCKRGACWHRAIWTASRSWKVMRAGEPSAGFTLAHAPHDKLQGR
eukprot:14722322-Alexandrium_andersonii.AAC.1